MKTTEVRESKVKDTQDRVPGSTAQIRDVMKKVESDVTCITPDKRFRKILKVLKKKDKKEIVQAVLEKFYNAEELKPYQAELIKMQRHLERTAKKNGHPFRWPGCLGKRRNDPAGNPLYE